MDTINENANFDQNDVFHRIEIAKKAMELIQEHRPERGACVIDIDAPWGMGKTTFFKMWINELEKDDERSRRFNIFSNTQNQCVYYNAWENDYYSDALSPLIYAICGSIYIKAKKSDKWLTEFRDKMKAIISAGVGGIVSFLCNQNTGNGVLASGIGLLATSTTEAGLHIFEGKDPEEIGDNYKKELEKRKAFHDAVSDLAYSCGKLFIFVDELDRCKPTFAVQTLECIKHYFNIPNVVFVFATDMGQLAHMVETYYGHGMDAGGYFLKFFDYIVHLPIPNIRELMYFAYPSIGVNEEFYEYVNEIRKNFSLTPREIPWVIRRTKMIWDGAFANHTRVNLSASFAYIAFLITVKTKLPSRFSKWITGKDDLTDTLTNDENTFIGQCSTFLRKHLMREIYDLEKEKEKTDERERRRSIDGIANNQEDLENVFIQTTYAICVSQMAVSQTVGEALHASLELL